MEETKKERANSANFIIPKLRAAVEILKSRIKSVPNNNKITLHNPRFKYNSRISLGPGAYELKNNKPSAFEFNDSPRFQSSFFHSILSKV